jgi:hypothetical protein
VRSCARSNIPAEGATRLVSHGESPAS